MDLLYRSLHVAEMFTAYRRQGTHFYTVNGIECWDGNIIEYPEVPYKYKDNPGSEFSAPTEEALTRDPRVYQFTNGEESNLAMAPPYRLGRYGEWIIDYANMTTSPEKEQWPYKMHDNDPDSQTIMLDDMWTFIRRDEYSTKPRRKRRALSKVKFKRPKQVQDKIGR